MTDLCFNNLAPLIISKTPDAIPVTRIQMPSTRLETADELMDLYNFSFMGLALLINFPLPYSIIQY